MAHGDDEDGDGDGGGDVRALPLAVRSDRLIKERTTHARMAIAAMVGWWRQHDGDGDGGCGGGGWRRR